MKVILTESQFAKLLEEEITKSDVDSRIDKKLSDYIKHNKDFEKQVKNIAGEVVKNLFRILWQKNNFYDKEIRQ